VIPTEGTWVRTQAARRRLGEQVAVAFFINSIAARSTGNQGQRPLTCCSGKDLQQEVVVPGAAAAFADDAVFAGMLLEQG
jgi:hypothetical protein